MARMTGRLTEKQYELLRRYETTGTQPDGRWCRSWLDLSHTETRRRDELVARRLLTYEGDGMHAITLEGKQALAGFRERHRIIPAVVA